MTPIRDVLLLTALLAITLHATAMGQSPLPGGPTPEPVAFPHFPSPLYTFLWRNWNAVDVDRLAKVLEATPDQVRELAAAMGLPPAVPVSEDMKRRNYLSIVRRNWHLLPYDQLLTLIDMSAEELAFILREEDFFYAKLGSLKPKCPRLAYQAPDDATRARLAEIKGWVEESFGDELKRTGEPRFAFVEEFRHAKPGMELRPIDKSVFKVKYIYSYFALFGDALLHPDLDPFPDGLLQRLAGQGVDGVWLHVVLRQLAPGGADFPELGADHEKRIENLKKLVARAKRFGISVYLYVNEPRSMPNAFFKNRPDNGRRACRRIHRHVHIEPQGACLDVGFAGLRVLERPGLGRRVHDQCQREPDELCFPWRPQELSSLQGSDAGRADRGRQCDH